MREDPINIPEEVSVIVHRMLDWLDVYASTNYDGLPNCGGPTHLDFRRAVLDSATALVNEGLRRQLEHYENEEAARLRSIEEAKQRGDSDNPKKGWWIRTMESRIGFNWSVIERMEQEQYKNKKRFFLYRKQLSEILCECKGRDGSSCTNCYGTNFEGGWVYAYPFPAVGARKEAQPDTEIDGRLFGEMHFQVSLFRSVRPGDVIVDEDDVRWRVLSVQGNWNQEFSYGWLVHAFTVHPTLGEAKFPLTHNEKKAPVNVSND